MMNKIEKLNGLILNNVSLGIGLVKDVNTWDGSLDYLEVFNMDEFNEIMHGVDPLEIATKMFYGNFNPNDEYFRYDICGHLESLDIYEIEEEIKDYSVEIVQRVIELYEQGHLRHLDYEILEILEDEQ